MESLIADIVKLCFAIAEFLFWEERLGTKISSFLKILNLKSFGKLVRQFGHSTSADNDKAPFHLR